MGADRSHRERVVVQESFDWDSLERTANWVGRRLGTETKVAVRGEDSRGQFETDSIAEARAHVADGGGELVLLNAWIEPEGESVPVAVRFHYWKPLSTRLHAEVEGADASEVSAFASSLTEGLERGLPESARDEVAPPSPFDWRTLQTLLRNPMVAWGVGGLILLVIVLLIL